ncbi:MAG: polyprenyl synthetase family protein [Anaerolineales bacterium]|nr:polyprenyl synthetase family protein [Anaerolineales bacterium]
MNPHHAQINQLFRNTYDFIQQIILPTFGWPEFDHLITDYRQKRIDTGVYVDIFPALASVASGGDVQQVIPLSAAWTLFMFAARVFDDLFDGEGYEHEWWQSETAVSTTGMFAIGAANVALSYIGDCTQQRDIAEAFNKLLVLAAKAEGKRPFVQHTSLEQYFTDIASKTGLVFATGAWSGGVIAGGDESTLNALYQFGLNLGMMEQIVDDCQDVLIDVQNGVWTLPMLYALAEAKKVGDGRFHNLLSQPKAISQWGDDVQSFLAKYDAVNWSLKVAEVYQCQAMSALAKLPDGCMADLEAYANRHIYQPA